MADTKKTLVIGASDNPSRYSYLAINRLRQLGHPVLAVGSRVGKAGDVNFSKERPEDRDIDTVTLYINPRRQPEYYDYILSLHPRRIIFNPGTENDDLKQLAEKNKIIPMEACTLVLLSTGAY